MLSLTRHSLRPRLDRVSRALVIFTIAAGCTGPGPTTAARPLPVAERYPILRPGDARIARRRPTGAECFSFTAYAPDDTIGRSLGTLAFEWGRRGEERAGSTWHRSAFGRQTEDTMVYDGASLAPKRESLRVGDQLITLRYHGATIERMVQRGDSIEPFHATTFDHPAFGFNQRELLLGVVRLQPHDTVILPLYSEIDAALELDTINLVPTPRANGSGSEVTIRFADPAIVTIVTVDTVSGRIVEETIQNRRRPGRLLRRSIADRTGARSPSDTLRCTGG